MMPLFCTGPRIYKAPSLTSLSPSKQLTSFVENSRKDDEEIDGFCKPTKKGRMALFL
jgi:hypothetical protein